MVFRVAFRDVLEGAWVLSVASGTFWDIVFSQFEWVRVSLVSLWGSPWFFGRVHFPLTIHTFFSLQCSCSLHSWTLPKRGIFVDPPDSVFFFYVYFSDYPGFQLNEAVRLRQGAESGWQGGKRREFAEKKGEEEKQRGGSGARGKGDLSTETSSFFRLAWMDPIACEYCSVLAPFHIYLFFGCKWLDSCLGSSWWLRVLY